MPLSIGMVQQRFHPSQDPPEWFRQYALSMGWDTSSGVNVDPDTAMRVTAALACIRIIADTESSLPFFTYRRLERGKEKARDHYLYRVLHDEANPEMSAFTFRRTITAHVASRGNGLAEIEFDGAGRVKYLWPLNPDKVRLIRQPKTRKLFYMVTLPESEGGYEEPLSADRVLHIKWLSQNGLWAMSPVQLNRESFGISLAAQEFMARFFSNDASPRGALETPNALSDKAYGRLKEDFVENHGGLSKKHRFAILEEGLKFNPISLSPQDIMLLDLMRFGVEDIGRLYGVSSDMLNLPDKAATYASVEQFGIRFTTHTVRPWTVNWDQEVNRTLLTKAERKEYFCEHNLDGLLRGDYATRTAGYNSGITTGWMTRNEAREFENLNPLDGLDEPLVQLNMTPDQQRAIMQPIYQDIFLRVRRREQHDVESAEKRFKSDVSDFVTWRRSFYADDHRKFVALQLAPALKAHAALRGEALIGIEIDALAESLAGKYCEEALRGGNPDLLRDWIKQLSERSEA